ncbi:MAG: acylphosphatase [Burkholderiales bacterium]
MVCKQLIIHGRVQGIGFRYAFAGRAQELRLKGWVRNRSDGAVEAVVKGEREAVERIVEWAKTGPDLARVDGIAVSEGEGEFERFEIRRTR